MANGKIKMNELPETALAKDSDIFIIENDNTTQKISLGSLINYIKEHEEIAEYFVKQSAVGSENGVAPLDSSRKIPSDSLPFGTTENTVYDGAHGQALSDNLSSHLSDTANPHVVTKSQVGLSDVDNTADAAKPVSTLQQKAIDTAYAGSNAYTDAKIAELIDGAPSTLDTLGEIARALQEGGGISDALDAAIGTKASQAELDFHTGNDTVHITASERTKWNNKMGSTEDAGNTTITFSEASDLSKINSGEKTGTIMGKISKAVSTLISHISAKATADTFGHVRLSDTYQNAVTDGNAANGIGASQKALADAYSSLNSNLTDSLGGITFGIDDDGNYGYKKAGADTVTPFKDINTMLSDVGFTCQCVVNSAWNSTGTMLTKANYEVPDDGILKIICKNSYYRSANQTTPNGNQQWHVIVINGNTVLNTQNGDTVLNATLTFDVAKGDMVEYRYYVKWTSGDALYAYVTASLATLFFKI